MAWTALKCSRINLWHSCQRKGVLIFFTVACHDYKVYWNLPRRNFITHKIYTYYSHGVYDFFTHIYIYNKNKEKHIDWGELYWKYFWVKKNKSFKKQIY